MSRTITAPLPKLQRDRYRKVLERKGAEVRTSLLQPVMVQSGPTDIGELAVRKHHEWLFCEQNHIEMTLLREINDALRRIQDGVYGLCESCENRIPEKRLKALPWARYCIGCQEARSV